MDFSKMSDADLEQLTGSAGKLTGQKTEPTMAAQQLPPDSAPNKAPNLDVRSLSDADLKKLISENSGLPKRLQTGDPSKDALNAQGLALQGGMDEEASKPSNPYSWLTAPLVFGASAATGVVDGFVKSQGVYAKLATGNSDFVKDLDDRRKSVVDPIQQGLKEGFPDNSVSNTAGGIIGEGLGYALGSPVGAVRGAAAGASALANTGSRLLQGAIPGFFAGAGETAPEAERSEVVGKGAVGAAAGGVLQAAAEPALSAVGNVISGGKGILTSGTKSSITDVQNQKQSVQDLLDAVSPKDPNLQANIKSAAKGIIADKQQSLSNLVDPVMQKIQGVQVAPDAMADITANPLYKDKVASVFQDLYKSGPDVPIVNKQIQQLPQDSLGAWDSVANQIGEQGASLRKTNPTEGRNLTLLSGQIKDKLSQVAPEYKDYRDLYQFGNDEIGGILELKDLKGSALGKAVAQNPTQLSNIAGKIMNPNTSDAAFGQMKDALVGANPDLYRATVRQFMGDLVDKTAQAGNPTYNDVYNALIKKTPISNRLNSALQDAGMEDTVAKLDFMRDFYHNLNSANDPGKLISNWVQSKLGTGANSTADEFNSRVADLLANPVKNNQVTSIYGNNQLTPYEKMDKTLQLIYKGTPNSANEAIGKAATTGALVYGANKLLNPDGKPMQERSDLVKQ